VSAWLTCEGQRCGEWVLTRASEKICAPTIENAFGLMRHLSGSIVALVIAPGGLTVEHAKDIRAPVGALPAVVADELAALMVGKRRKPLVFTDRRGGVLRNSSWRARVFQPAVKKCKRADESFRLSRRTTCDPQLRL
jgi:hypothetical protein